VTGYTLMRPHTFQPRNSTFLQFYDLPHPPATTIDVLRPPATSIEPQQPRSKPSDHLIDHFRYSARALYPSARPRDPQRSPSITIDPLRLQIEASIDQIAPSIDPKNVAIDIATSHGLPLRWTGCITFLLSYAILFHMYATHFHLILRPSSDISTYPLFSYISVFHTIPPLFPAPSGSITSFHIHFQSPASLHT
jgi:hypothetical protein